MDKQKKILIVEDEAINAMYLKIMLKSDGYDITETVATAEDAIASVERNCPDLVLMDITLRGSIDGIEAATILRKNYDFGIIFISGYDDQETLNKITAIEKTWKLNKPIDELKLINMISEICA